MKTGVVSLNIKGLIKRYQARCAPCRRIRLLPSNNLETPENSMLFSNSPPFSCTQMDIAGAFQLKNQEKAYCLINVCSWSSAVLLAPLRSLSASEVLQGLESSMTSIGRVMPVKIYSDSAPSFLTLNEARQGIETGGMEDSEYQNLKKEISEQGIKLVNHAPFSPHKTGKVERKVANLKQMIKAHTGNLKNLDFFEFFHLIKKCQYLINSRPISSYSSVMSTMIITPNDLLYPAQSAMYSADLKSFPQERNLGKIYNKTNDLYTSFKEIYLTLYVEAARRRNKQTSKRKLEPEDIVIILDRITRGSDLTLGQVIKVDDAQKNVLLRTIQRGARMNNVFKILDPAKHTRLVRSPHSLVFIFRPDQRSDILEYYRSGSAQTPNPEIWDQVETETVESQ